MTTLTFQDKGFVLLIIHIEKGQQKWYSMPIEVKFTFNLFEWTFLKMKRIPYFIENIDWNEKDANRTAYIR